MSQKSEQSKPTQQELLEKDKNNQVKQTKQSPLKTDQPREQNDDDNEISLSISNIEVKQESQSVIGNSASGWQHPSRTSQVNSFFQKFKDQVHSISKPHPTNKQQNNTTNQLLKVAGQSGKAFGQYEQGSIIDSLYGASQKLNKSQMFIKAFAGSLFEQSRRNLSLNQNFKKNKIVKVTFNEISSSDDQQKLSELINKTKKQKQMERNEQQNRKKQQKTQANAENRTRQSLQRQAQQAAQAKLEIPPSNIQKVQKQTPADAKVEAEVTVKESSPEEQIQSSGMDISIKWSEKQGSKQKLGYIYNQDISSILVKEKQDISISLTANDTSYIKKPIAFTPQTNYSYISDNLLSLKDDSMIEKQQIKAENRQQKDEENVQRGKIFLQTKIFYKQDKLKPEEPKQVEVNGKLPNKQQIHIQVQSNKHQYKQQQQSIQQSSQYGMHFQQQQQQVQQGQKIQLKQKQQQQQQQNKENEKEKKHEQIIKGHEENSDQWESDYSVDDHVQHAQSGEWEQDQSYQQAQQYQQYSQQEQQQQQQQLQQQQQQQQQQRQIIKSKIFGVFLLKTLPTPICQQLCQTAERYYPSSGQFHVAARYQMMNILNAICKMTKKQQQSQLHQQQQQLANQYIQLVQQFLPIQAITLDQYIKNWEENVAVLGIQARLYVDQSMVQQFQHIYNQNYGSKYFKVGPKRQMFSWAQDLIRIVQKNRTVCKNKLAQDRNQRANGNGGNNNSNNGGNGSHGNNGGNNDDDEDGHNNNDDNHNDDNGQQAQLSSDGNEQTDLNQRISQFNNRSLNQMDSLLQQTQFPMLYDQMSTQCSNASFQSKTPTFCFNPVTTISPQKKKQSQCGEYLLKVLTPSLQQSLLSTLSQYNSSNYFHVGPRYELLGFMENLVNKIKQIQQGNANIKVELDVGKKIRIGEEVMKYFDASKRKQIISTCNSYSSSNYFHVGPRYSILGDVRKLINIVRS